MENTLLPRQTFLAEPPVYEQPPPPYEFLDEHLPQDTDFHTTRSASDSASFYDDERFDLPPSPRSTNSNPDDLPPAYISRRTLFHPPGFVPSNTPSPAPRPYVPSSSNPLHTPRGFVPSNSSPPQASSWSHETLTDKEKALQHPKGFKPTRPSASSSSATSYHTRNAPTTTPLPIVNNKLSKPRGFKPSSDPLHERTVMDIAHDIDQHRRRRYRYHSHGDGGLEAASSAGAIAGAVAGSTTTGC